MSEESKAVDHSEGLVEIAKVGISCDNVEFGALRTATRLERKIIAVPRTTERGAVICFYAEP